MRSKIKIIPIALAILGILGTFTMINTRDVYASGIQAHSEAEIFAAACATCHGRDGLGGVTWIKNDPTDKWTAPKIAGKSLSMIKSKVRNGSNNGRMPAFGPEEITATELNNLASWLNGNPGGVGALLNALDSAQTATEVTLNIVDADPWYQDASGSSRVALGATDHLKIYNAGRTWHTFTNPAISKDSGYIGYAGNYNNAAGDLGDMGYYYAAPGTGLGIGCERYLCKIHPYMQVEVCTSGYTPRGTGDIGVVPYFPGGPAPWVGTTRAHKHPIGLPSAVGVFGTAGEEIWAPLQSQQEIGESTDVFAGGALSTNNFDGAFEVIDASTWALIQRIPNVGNNPHNAWGGKDAGGLDDVISASWHDNKVSLMDADGAPGTYSLLYERRSGADNAHIMTTPSAGGGYGKRFYTSHMGGRAIQELNAAALRLGSNPNVIAGHIRGATGPHGLWVCDDGVHILTADTFGQSATLFNTALKKAKTAGSGGKAPLAPAVVGGFQGGCRRGFTNNALTADISIYDMSTPVTSLSGGISHNTGWVPPVSPLAHVDKNLNGNIDLRNLTVSQQDGLLNPVSGAPSTVFMARWANLPIQTPVSPAGSGDRHGTYMVTANKASFNVQMTKIDPTTGLPVAFYTFPAGLGAHGVNFGTKDAAGCTNGTTGNCYLAYVSNTFEDYLSVYDLEAVETCTTGGTCPPGSALLAERAYVEGGAISAVAALDPAVAGLCDAFGGTLLQCGVGPTGGFYVANLPIGVVCPDCRSTGHVGDIPFSVGLGEGAPTAGPAGPQPGPCVASAADPLFGPFPLCPAVVNSGAAPTRYTYVKDEVYVDTETVACVLDALGYFGGPPGGVNDCTTGTVDAAGTLNLLVSMDLELGINTGQQGVMVRETTTGTSPVLPWP